MGSITINDLNDAIVSGTAPTNPEAGQLWLNENVLKQYKNGKWETVTLDILKMDEALGITIKGIETTLGNISSDGNLSYIDRKIVAQNVGEIIGEMPSTSKSSMSVLPDYTALDSRGQGTFAFLRATALSIGITADETIYKEMELTYKNLATYLASTNPKMWDVTEANETKIITLSNTDDFNGYFLNYYLAEASLSTEIDKRANALMLKITEGAKSGVVVKDIEGIELYTTKADLNGALDIVVEGGTENLSPLGEDRNYVLGSATYRFGTSYFVGSYDLSETLPRGTKIKISILGGADSTMRTFGVWINNSAGTTGSNSQVIDTVKQPGLQGRSSNGDLSLWTAEATLQVPASKILIYGRDNDTTTAKRVEFVQVTTGKTFTPWKLAPEDMTTPNLVSANNFNLVSQMGKFKSMSAREDTKEITNIWTKHTTTKEVLNEPYTSERYPYLNLRKVGFKDITAVYRSGGEQLSEGIRSGVYTYVLYLKPLVANFIINHNGLNSIKGIMYRDGERSTYTGNRTLMKGSEYLLIATFTHRSDYNFWQLHLNSHGSKDTEFVMSNLLLFEGDVASEIEATLPGVGTILNPSEVTGTPDWAKISSSYVALPQPLRDAGNGVRDQLRRNDDGRWEILRRANELEVQDAFSSMAQNNTNTIRIGLYTYSGKNALGKPNATGNVTGLKSSHFSYSGNPVEPSSTDWTIGMNGASGALAHNLIFKLPTEYGTVQAFKDFATSEAKKGNPIRVVYELREPYVEALSDEVQITLDKVFTYPHSNSIYTVFPDLDKSYNHPHPYLRANFLGGAEGTRKRTQVDLNNKANQKDVDNLNEAIVTVNATTENLGDRLENTVTELSTLDSAVSGIESKLTQTASGWDFRFSNFATSVSDLEKETTDGFSRINSYIRFEGGKIILGQEGSNTFLEIAPDRINFNNGGVVVAYISNQTMEITHGIFVQTATIAGMRIQRVPGSNNIGFTII